MAIDATVLKAAEQTDPAAHPGYPLTDEECRTYHFPNGATMQILFPQRLWVKKGERGDSHRIETLYGGVYIPPGWIAIQWTVKPGFPKVAF